MEVYLPSNYLILLRLNSASVRAFGQLDVIDHVMFNLAVILVMHFTRENYSKILLAMTYRNTRTPQ